MTLQTISEDMLKDPELNHYFSSVQALQAWLLDEVQDEEVQDAVNEVLSFVKAGTKVRRKKNMKLYFEQFDADMVKQFVGPLAGLAQESNPVHRNTLKNELISLGMLSFTKEYMMQYSAYAPQSKVEPSSPYTEWLKGDVKNVIEQLRVQHENGIVSEQLVRTFVRAFRKFVGKKLVFRITDMTNKAVAGMPLELTADGYREMQHPFLSIPWEVSTPVEKYSKNITYDIGDLVEASYNESRNENFRHLCIFVDFGNAVPVPMTMVDTLSAVLKPTVAREVLAQIQAPDDDETLQAYVIQKLVEKSVTLKARVESALTEVNDQLQELEKRQLKLDVEEKSLDAQSKKWKTIIDRIDSYKKAEQYQTNVADDVYELFNYEPKTLIKQLQSLFYYNDDQQLVYQEDIIRSFVYAIQANILTVLAGPSGTGKSSIVHAFARSVDNVEVRMVPVQSSWTDTQDLIGYFHPTDKAFVPTPFMEAMAEAAQEENAQKIFLICLDEMNLAHVEYYFSEILSAREDKKQEIRLYPKRHWETAKQILAEGKADIERLQSAAELIKFYPPVFTIPANVRFIGTLNMDHTVKPLSPKVIDRSFIIEINHLKAKEKQDIIASLLRMEGKIEMDYAAFTEEHMDEIFLEFYLEKLQKVSNLFEDYSNASLNSRGFKHLTKMLTYCKSGDEMSELLDSLVYGKILPRLEIKKTDFVQQANTINKELEQYPKSAKKLEKMTDTKHTITFW